MRRGIHIWMPLFVCYACVEEAAVQSDLQSTIAVEDILVVDAKLTDELKNQQVLLTRVFALEEEEPVVEIGAQVQVVDSQGMNFVFEEVAPGSYLSELAFAAEQSKSYRLEIITQDEKKYVSSEVAVPNAVPIGDIRAQRITNDSGEEGVGIFLDNSAAGEEPTFFRYEYEETYKIIAPNWEPFRFEVVRYAPCFTDPFVLEIMPWEDEHKTCYKSSKSQRLITASSVELDGNTIDNYQLHFISRDNHIISHRYSMNVTQYAQTADAYSFYERLGDFSSLDIIFSQIQPGFLEGNIVVESNPEEYALGYFEVSSVSTKRMYFNYVDLFPDEPLPPYPENCDRSNLQLINLTPWFYSCAGSGICNGNCDSPLIEAILAGEIVFAAENLEYPSSVSYPYYSWPSACGDCTKLGSNVAPEFWLEE